MAYIVKPVEEKNELGIQRLQELVRSTCLRRTKQKTLASGAFNLPHRSERIQHVNLHPDDQALYEAVKSATQKTAAGLDKPLRIESSVKDKHENVMVLLNSLRLICNHGKELVPHLAKSIMEKTSVSNIHRNQRQIHGSACSSCGAETDGGSASTELPDSLCVNCATLEATCSDPNLRGEPENRQGVSPSQSASIEQSSLGIAVRPSAKIVALIKNLRHEASVSDHEHKFRKRYITHSCQSTLTNTSFLLDAVLCSATGSRCLI